MKANEIINLCKKEGIKYIALKNSDDTVLIARNTPKMDISIRAKEIEQILKSELIPDGNYYLCLYRSPKSEPFKIVVKKGAELADGVPVVSVTSYENVIALNKTISDLQNKINFLEKENESLLNDFRSFDDNEAIEVDPVPGLAERSAGWLSEMAIILAPLADKYFSLQERKISLSEEENKIRYAFNNQSKGNAITDKEIIETVNEFYQNNDIESVNDFEAFVKANDIDQYKRIFVNG